MPSVGTCILVALFCVVLSFWKLGIHKVEEGHVGLYWRGGALLDGVTEPGYHLMIPFITTSENVQVTLQTDLVKNIPCGTSGGVMIYFEKIEVVNQLRKEHVHETIKKYGTGYDKIWIFDKIHHEINQFCSKHTLQEVYIDEFDQLDEALQKALQDDCNKWDTGIDIINIRVTKPKIPEAIMQNYLAVSEEKTRLLVAEQHQLLVKREEDTKRTAARIAAEREAEVSKINAQKEAAVAIIAQERDANVSLIRLAKEVKEKENEARKLEIDTEMQVLRKKREAESEAAISEVRNKMRLEEAKSKAEAIRLLADANAYAIETEGRALNTKLSPNYLAMVAFESVANNTKVYFGPDIPKMYLDSLILRDKLSADDKSKH